MAYTQLTSLPRPLPATVRIEQGTSLSPNEMRTLKELTGRSLTELLGGDIDDIDQAPDRIQSLVWVELRRQGYEVTWEQAGDVRPEFVAADPDPTNAGPSTSSPGSAATGG